VNGKLKMLPGGKLGRNHANFKFDPQDFRFTVGKNGEFYAFCLTVPAPGTPLKIKSLGSDAKYLGQPVKSVKLLGHDGELQWKQEADGLTIACPVEMPFETSIVFKIE
jgi:alpha-L-fucosidase